MKTMHYFNRMCMTISVMLIVIPAYSQEVTISPGLFVRNNAFDTAIFTNPSADVGIGTSRPQAQLHVNGRILGANDMGIGVLNPLERLHVNGRIY